jgi:O-antigen/teichoic acid export membrane protein
VNVQLALVRNTVWYGAVTVVGLVSGLVMSIIWARGLGPSLMGDLSYVVWAERLLTAVASLGYTYATVRYTAEAFGRGDGPRAWGVVRLFWRRQLVTTVIVVAVMIPVILAVAPPGLQSPILVVALTLFFITIESIYTHALQGAQRYDITARTSTIKMALQLVVVALVMHFGGGLTVLFAALSVTLVITLLIQRRGALAVYREHRTAPVATLTPEMRAFLGPLSVVAVLDAIVWDRSEVFFLGLYATSAEIAYYSLAFGLAARAMIIPGIAVGALLPAFSALHGRGAPEEFARLYRTALRYVALIGAPMSALVGALSPGIITWLYGDAYLPAASMVGVLAAVSLLSALRAVAWAALRAVGDRRCALTATWVAAVVNVGLAALLIPFWTTTGAVIANAAGQLTATVWVFVGIARAHRLGFPLADLVRTAAAGGLSLVTARVLAGDAHDLARLTLAAAGGLVAFLLAALALRLIGPREWNLLTTSTRRLLTSRAGVTTP